MSILKHIIMVVHILICIGIIILVLMQSSEDSGASATVMGAGASNFYEKNKGRTKEGKMKKATSILMIAFAVTTIVLTILNNL